MNKLWEVIQGTYHFLGSVYFAIALIGTTTLLVMLGTFAEAVTGSHRYATSKIYTHPAFLTLLSLFFINILFSALRRWPFRKSHIPFLLTHLGLLMILSGTFMKSLWGVQGTMGLIEGTGKESIFLDNSFEILIEQKEPFTQLKIPLEKRVCVENLHMEVLSMSPHIEEKIVSWIYGNFALISGIPPLPVISWTETNLIPEMPDAVSWNICAFRTDNVETLLEHIYLNQSQLIVRDRSNRLLFSSSLKEALISPQNINGQPVRFTLNLDFSEIEGFQEPTLKAEYPSVKVVIPLNGNQMLYNIASENFTFPLQVEIDRPPVILIIADEAEDTHIVAFGKGGQVHHERFPNNEVHSLVSYDKGYGGYAIQCEIPFDVHSVFRDTRKERLQKKLQQVDPSLLPRPLQLFYEVCQQINIDFSLACVEFLEDWDRSCCLLYPENRKLPDNAEKVFSHLARISHTMNPSLYSAYLLQHKLSFPNLISPETEPTVTSIETPYSPRYYFAEPKKKWEENIPAVLLKFTLARISHKGSSKDEQCIYEKCGLDQQDEEIALRYDPYGTGLKWPIFEGKYLLRFQPRFIDIPYHIRLRDARQIARPNSSQPLSYESDLLITDRRSDITVASTISMNQVYETWDGYRFYLANITPPQEIAAQRVQIIVNRDPAKYFLTYPGCWIVALGILLLFWFPRNRSPEN